MSIKKLRNGKFSEMKIRNSSSPTFFFKEKRRVKEKTQSVYKLAGFALKICRKTLG